MTLVNQYAERSLQSYHETEQVQTPKYLPHPVLQLTGHSGAVNECHFSPSGNILCSCANEIIMWSYDAQNGVKSIGSLRPHSFPITSFSWNIDGNLIASASSDKTVAVLDSEYGKVIRRFKDHRDIVNCVKFYRETPELVFSGDDSGFVIVNDIRCKDIVTKLKSNSPVVDLAINGDLIAVAGVDSNVYINKFVDEMSMNKKLKLIPLFPRNWRTFARK